MTAQLSRERLEEKLLEHIKHGGDSEEETMIRMLLAGMDSEPVADVVAWSSPNEERKCDIRWRRHDVAPGPLYAAPPAPVVVPDEQHSKRFEWSYEDWANHLGGRHQNNDPACYYEFGSFMAVAEMLRQFGNVQRKIGWNACRAAMLKAEPLKATTVPEGWKLVPVEPTEAMLDAAYSHPASTTDRMHKQYCAMLAAAPKAPAQEE